MKKVFKIGLMLSLLVATTGVFAQDNIPEDKPEFPRVGFKSYWSWGGALELSHQFAMDPSANSTVGGGLGLNRNIGLDIFFQKKINHMFDLRLRLDFTGVIPPADTVLTEMKGYRVMAQPIALDADFLWSINNAIMGYDPNRNWSIYAVAGAGITTGIIDYINRVAKIGAQGERLEGIYDGFLGMNMNFGLGFDLGITNNDFLFVEYTINAFADLKLIQKNDNGDKTWPNTASIVRFGYHRYFYNDGLTDEDKALIDQRSALTFSNFRRLNNQINALESQVATSRNNEKRLENRIAELEDQIDKLSKGGQVVDNSGNVIYVPSNNAAAADSLQAVIDQIKADQLNFYAMPFSVQYGVDEWQVSEEEMAKIDAIARVLKDNPDIRIKVVGFADKSGSDQYNQRLSERRANEVKRLLVRRGVADDRIDVEAKGKTVAFGDIQYAINRRVSFYRVID